MRRIRPVTPRLRVDDGLEAVEIQDSDRAVTGGYHAQLAPRRVDLLFGLLIGFAGAFPRIGCSILLLLTVALIVLFVVSNQPRRTGMAAEPGIEALAWHFRNAAAAVFDTSPLYQALCPAVAEDRRLLDLLTRRRSGQQPSYLLFGAVHYLLLDGADRPAEAGPVFIDFCHEYWAPLEDLIHTRLVQSNVVRRAIGLRYALWHVAQRIDGPVHLVEVGASAGLLMNVDRYRYLIGEREFGEPDAPVVLDSCWRGAHPIPDLDAIARLAGKIGVDLNPIDLADGRERLWLRALVWPEQHSAAAILEAAIDEAREEPLTIIAGDVIDVCPALAHDLPAGEPRVAFHAATRMHVPDERREAFDEAIDSLGATGPLFHVWIEPPNAPHHGYPVAARGVVAMHGPGDDAATALVRVDGHLHWLEPLR